MSNRIKRNIFLTMSVIGLGVIVARAFDFFAGGDTAWWEVLGAVVIYATCFKFYLGYRKAAKADA